MLSPENSKNHVENINCRRNKEGTVETVHKAAVPRHDFAVIFNPVLTLYNRRR